MNKQEKCDPFSREETIDRYQIQNVIIINEEL